MGVSTTVTSRDTLINYCKRKLGWPVIDINIDPDQIADRVDDALQFMAEYHFDAMERTYLSHQLTETDITNSYIDLTATGGVDTSDQIASVIRVLPVSNRSSGMFDIRYQYALNDLYRYGTLDLLTYHIVQTHMSLLNQMFATSKTVRFNRQKNFLYLETDWSEEFNAGDYIVMEAWVILDPETYTDIYNNIFLKRYCTALLKQQWGTNLKKFAGIMLPGNVTLNGEVIYDEATAEIQVLEDTMISKWEEPCDFQVG